jgi:uncharacterized RDD family membrane protein YckC
MLTAREPVAKTNIKMPSSDHLKDSSANLAAPPSKPRQFPYRRASRVSLSIAVIVSGDTKAGAFSEESRTLNVSARGALLALNTSVIQTQLITLTNRSSLEQTICRVVRVKATPEGSFEAGVEFVEPGANFWGIVFPPADWIRTDQIVKRTNIGPLPRNRLAEQVGENFGLETTDQALPTYAGVLPRLAAAFIDVLILGVVLGTGDFLANLIAPGTGVVAGKGASTLVIVMTLNIVYLYFICMESSPWQATFGKKMLGLYVTSMSGGRITPLRATGRIFAKYLTGMSLSIGFFILAFTAQKQALHDKISSCLVLRRH